MHHRGGSRPDGPPTSASPSSSSGARSDSLELVDELDVYAVGGSRAEQQQQQQQLYLHYARAASGAAAVGAVPGTGNSANTVNSVSVPAHSHRHETRTKSGTEKHKSRRKSLNRNGREDFYGDETTTTSSSDSSSSSTSFSSSGFSLNEEGGKEDVTNTPISPPQLVRSHTHLFTDAEAKSELSKEKEEEEDERGMRIGGRRSERGDPSHLFLMPSLSATAASDSVADPLFSSLRSSAPPAVLSINSNNNLLAVDYVSSSAKREKPHQASTKPDRSTHRHDRNTNENSSVKDNSLEKDRGTRDDRSPGTKTMKSEGRGEETGSKPWLLNELDAELLEIIKAYYQNKPISIMGYDANGGSNIFHRASAIPPPPPPAPAVAVAQSSPFFPDQNSHSDTETSSFLLQQQQQQQQTRQAGGSGIGIKSSSNNTDGGVKPSKGTKSDRLYNILSSSPRPATATPPLQSPPRPLDSVAVAYSLRSSSQQNFHSNVNRSGNRNGNGGSREDVGVVAERGNVEEEEEEGENGEGQVSPDTESWEVDRRPHSSLRVPRLAGWPSLHSPSNLNLHTINHNSSSENGNEDNNGFLGLRLRRSEAGAISHQGNSGRSPAMPHLFSTDSGGGVGRAAPRPGPNALNSQQRQQDDFRLLSPSTHSATPPAAAAAAAQASGVGGHDVFAQPHTCVSNLGPPNPSNTNSNSHTNSGNLSSPSLVPIASHRDREDNNNHTSNNATMETGSSAIMGMPSYSATSFVRAYVNVDANLHIEPAAIVSGLAAALNIVVVYFLQNHVLDTRDHLGVFLIGSYLIFASYYMIYYFLELFSSSFRRISSNDKKFYIIGNLIKAGIFISITPFAFYHLIKIIAFDEWEGDILRNLGCIYSIPDFISMIVVKHMRWSTWIHHLLVIVFNYFSVVNNYNEENICRCLVVYAAFSSFSYCVNVLLASRFLGVPVAAARVLSFISLVIYVFCCAVNWAWQAYYLRRLILGGHDHWTVYVYMVLICLVMWDDLILCHWLLHHARSTAFAATQQLHALRRQQQQQQQQQQQHEANRSRRSYQ